MQHILSLGAIAFYLYKYFSIFNKDVIFIMLKGNYRYIEVIKLLEMM